MSQGEKETYLTWAKPVRSSTKCPSRRASWTQKYEFFTCPSFSCNLKVSCVCRSGDDALMCSSGIKVK